jgi:inner membrane protein
VDNLAHTLVGAALGRVVAGKRVPAAGWIGAIAANAPDWTELLIGFRPDRGGLAYYVSHRGITHSLLGAAVETVALTSVLWGLFAVLHRRWGVRAVPLGVLTALVAATVFSHLYMDWQGSYGLRPWLPWSSRWYYADWVAIADPMFWLIPLVGLAWGAERHWRDLVPIVLLAALILLGALMVDSAATWLRWSCAALVAIGAVGWVRHWFGVVARRRAAVLSLAVLAVYAGAQGLASAPAKRAVHRTALARFGPSAAWAALTRVGTPFEWEAMYASGDTVAGREWALPRHLDDPDVQWVLRETVAGRALAGFARFLAAEVDSGPRGVTVTLRDTRYARTGTQGWAVVTVPLPRIAHP